MACHFPCWATSSVMLHQQNFKTHGFQNSLFGGQWMLILMLNFGLDHRWHAFFPVSYFFSLSRNLSLLFVAVCVSLSVFSSICMHLCVSVKGELCHLQSQGHLAAPTLSTESHVFRLQFFSLWACQLPWWKKTLFEARLKACMRFHHLSSSLSLWS